MTEEISEYHIITLVGDKHLLDSILKNAVEEGLIKNIGY